MQLYTMPKTYILPVLGVIIAMATVATGATPEASNYHEYCIIGAGPGGLQMGHFMNKANRNYIIFERGNVSGNFFVKYPRHERLISINKRNTGKTNKEFNMRHDWNSLLSDDESLQIRHYSKEFFPHKDVLLKYLDDYKNKLNIKVQYQTDISNVRKKFSKLHDRELFYMEDQHKTTYTCKVLIVATGYSKPNIPNFKGSEYTEGYEDISVNGEDYEGQSVLILGRGNTAFEVADSILGYTNVVHMVGRSRVRLSWATHYVGDLRAVNNGLLDTYQLKSLDGLLESPVEDAQFEKREDGKIYLNLEGLNQDDAEFDNFALREGYDRVIRCLGFKFDHTIFANHTRLNKGSGRKSKFPKIKENYESTDIDDLFIAGTAGHSLDFRKSSGGFIHGFRYTALALHRLLEWRYQQVKWPSKTGPITDLLNTIVKRINEASGPYQMFAMLGDVYGINKGGTEYEVIEEFPINNLHQLPNLTGHNFDRIIVCVLQYGANFSGPGEDIFRLTRATGEPGEAHMSNFLHPVFYYYESLPTENQMKQKYKWEILPRPNMMHHIVEDFLTLWDGPTSHILPLRRFLENVIGDDLRNYFAEDCLKMALTSQTVPLNCENYFLKGLGIPQNNDFETVLPQISNPEPLRPVSGAFL
ncbi:unnamed protein product [Owenia fusiformis]|uniref:Uncharacterized protein n=1 Tax=Owenia fusiformis TaxID=6347 RepID=A0A8J1XZH8_OWEFU|nr:unnamed protein product [Owenia fusiformis]